MAKQSFVPFASLVPRCFYAFAVKTSHQYYANFQCQLFDGSRAAKHNLFVWELMKASWPSSPRLPRTFHYRGNGEFMISGQTVRRRSKFLPQNV